MPWNTRGGRSAADSSVIGSFPAIAMMPGVFQSGLREVLLPDPRASAIGPHQQIAGGTRAVGEVCGYCAVRMLLEAGELLAERDHILQAGHQHLS